MKVSFWIKAFLPLWVAYRQLLVHSQSEINSPNWCPCFLAICMCAHLFGLHVLPCKLLGLFPDSISAKQGWLNQQLEHSISPGRKLLHMNRAAATSRFSALIPKGAVCAKESKCQSKRRKGYDHSIGEWPQTALKWQQVLYKPIKKLYVFQKGFIKPTEPRGNSSHDKGL